VTGWLLRCRRALLVLVLALLTVMLPDAKRHPVEWSLVEVEPAKAVDPERDVIWVLALGSDARPGEDVMSGRADAIHLVGVDFEHRRAVGIGVPRDAWVELGEHGSSRINEGLPAGGPRLVAEEVEELVGIAPDYVVTTGFAGLRDVVDVLGGVEVFSEVSFRDPRHSLTVTEGANHLTGREAVGLARSRYPLPGGDFDRSAHHQEIMRGVLRSLRAQEDRVGFVEEVASVAWRGVHSELSLAELYRLTQALTQVELSRSASCVLTAVPEVTSGGASVVRVDAAQARRLGADARDDLRLQGGCRP